MTEKQPELSATAVELQDRRKFEKKNSAFMTWLLASSRVISPILQIYDSARCENLE